MRTRFAASLAAALAIALATGAAHAGDAEVTAEAASQFYDVRSPTGETILSRRRLTATLGVAAYNLVDAPPGDPKAADLSFRARLRYDADYGASGSTTDPANYANFVPGFSQGPLDLMYAYLEGRRLLHGWLGFRLGRQYQADALGWWSFDGAQANLTTPFFFKAEVYGGLEQRGGFPLSTRRFESDGVWRGDRAGFDASLYPSFQPAGIAPAVGAAIETAGVTWIHGRLSYRRVYNTGSSNVTEFASGLSAPVPYDGTRISSERLGYAVDANWADVGGAKAGVVYDFWRSEVTSLYGSLDAYLGRRVTVSADYDYYVPAFDADSIWNFFAGEPMNDVGLRANVDVDNHLSLAGGGHVRMFSVQTAPFDPGLSGTMRYQQYPGYTAAQDYFPTNGHPFDEGGNLSVRWRKGATLLNMRGSGNFGDEGERVGGDVFGQQVFETR
jgi:hypothetical protein